MGEAIDSPPRERKKPISGSFFLQSLSIVTYKLTVGVKEHKYLFLY
jgi:hypothetical protein